MKERYYGSAKLVAGFLIAGAVAFGLNLAPQDHPLHWVPSVLFCCIVTAWAFSVRERIIHRRIRFYLLFGAFHLAALFVLRVCRWDLFDRNYKAQVFLLYLYYIPIIFVPICALGASLCLDRPEEARSDRAMWLLWLFGALLIGLILTNDCHHLFMLIHPGTRIAHRPVFFVTVAFCIVLVILCFVVAMKRCTLSAVKSRWYIPVFMAAAGAVLLVVYFLAGGSPTVAGRKLFHLQDVYALLFIGFLESCIEIGLIPSNYGYAQLFEEADMIAWIEDSKHTPVYETKKHRENPESREGRRFQHRQMPVPGGSIHWQEDLTQLYALREELSAEIERIADENTLIRYENEIKARSAEVDARDRLYGRIARITQPQADRLKTYIELAERDAPHDRKWIAFGAVSCACIKRRANLELISFEAGQLSMHELYVSVSEICDCLSRAGIEASAQISGECVVLSAIALHTFSLFERALDYLPDGGSAITVRLSCEGGFLFRLMTDARLAQLAESEDVSALRAVGCVTGVTTEEGVSYLTVDGRGGGLAE